MDSLALEGSWVAIHVQSNREKQVFMGLKDRNYEPFLPLYKARSIRFKRTVELDLPLFPGYLFCRWLNRNRHLIVQIPGVIRTLAFGKIPACVDEKEIIAIRCIVDSGVISMPWKFARSGQRVSLTSGPLCGLEGHFVRVLKVDYLVVNVTLLGRAVAVRVHASQTAPCEVLRDQLGVIVSNSHGGVIKQQRSR
jgi:transcription antitermination factor NusG